MGLPFLNNFGLALGFTWGLILGIGVVATGVVEFDRRDLAITAPSLFVMIAGLTLSVRRLHDIDRSGWWTLIPLPLLVFSF